MRFRKRYIEEVSRRERKSESERAPQRKGSGARDHSTAIEWKRGNWNSRECWGFTARERENLRIHVHWRARLQDWEGIQTEVCRSVRVQKRVGVEEVVMYARRCSSAGSADLHDAEAWKLEFRTGRVRAGAHGS